MSRIEFEQISEDEVEVVLPPETPMEMVEQIRKSFIARGLVEDLAKSTVSTRYFYRPQDEVNQLADKLIKSLKGLAKDDFDYSPQAKRQWKRSMAAKDAVNASRVKPPNLAAPAAPKMYDSSPAAQRTAEGTGKRYAYISDKVNKQEHKEDDPKCECEKCSVEKSNYGPKGAKLYNPPDNARRKERNLTDQVPAGPNANVKAYSTRPGQLSIKQQADEVSRKQNALNRKQPVRTMKDMTPQELAALTAKTLKKSWGDHLPFPNAEEEMAKQEEVNPVERAENLMSNQLANLMNNKAMLNPLQRQPSSEDMIMAGERMGLGTNNEEVMKAQDQAWGTSINDFYREAAKPLSQRFASEEEELAYWNSIKVGDRDDGKPGY